MLARGNELYRSLVKKNLKFDCIKHRFVNSLKVTLCKLNQYET